MNRDNSYDVIIVGGGIAGLTAGAYLSKDGYQILLCEQSETTGGLVNSFQRSGFVFDVGIRAFENSGIVFPMLNQLGISLDFVHNPVTIGIGSDVIEIRSRDSLYDYETLLVKHFPANRKEIRDILNQIERVMNYMDVIYGIDNPLFLDYKKDRKYLIKTLLPWLLRYRKNMKKAMELQEPINDYLRKFTDNQQLIDIITQHFFSNTPTFFALSYFGLYLDYIYPVGGTGMFTKKMTQYIEENQGVIAVNQRIIEVHMDENKIITEDGNSITYQKLIWACDAKHLFQCLKSKDKSNMKKIQNKKKLMEGSRGSNSVLTMYLAVDVAPQYFQEICGPHCFYTPNTKGISSTSLMRENSDEKSGVWRQQLMEYLSHTTYEISCPATRDATLAPEGSSGLIISTLMDYDFIKMIEEMGYYEECKEFAMDIMLNTLEQGLFPSIRSKILFRFCSTPLTIKNRTGNSDGAITGWAFHHGTIPSETKFQKILKSVDTGLKDIDLVGQWSFSPSGLPTCILTGKVAADRIVGAWRKG